jgi:hypothetical protein
MIDWYYVDWHHAKLDDQGERTSLENLFKLLFLKKYRVNLSVQFVVHPNLIPFLNDRYNPNNPNKKDESRYILFQFIVNVPTLEF